jgi:hypothetical protein
MRVYLLSHTHEVNPGEDDEKLIGIYGTYGNAEAARQRASGWPGVSRRPERV